MFQLISKKSNIFNFAVIKGDLVQITKENDIIHNESIVNKNVDSNNFTIFKNDIVYIKNQNTYLGGKIINTFSYLKNSIDFISETIITQGEFEVEDYKVKTNFKLIDLNSNKESSIGNLYNIVNVINDSKFILLGSSESIYCFNKNEIIEKWSLNSQILGKYLNKRGNEIDYTIENFIGIWKNELIVGFSNSLIVSLDVDTGKEIRRWQALEGYYSDIRGVANQIPASKKFILDKENNKLIALQISSYVEIDLTNGKIVTVSLNEEMEKVGVHHLNDQLNYGISPTHLYTNATGTDYKLNESYQNLIAINRNNFEIDWYYRFSPEDQGVNGAPVFDNGNLYQLTGSGTLFIFESVN